MVMSIRYKIVKHDNSSCFTKEPYRLFYRDGTTVVAPEGTMGCMVFDTKEHAVQFMGCFPRPFEFYKIKRVIGIGKEITARCVAAADMALSEFYNNWPAELNSLRWDHGLATESLITNCDHLLIPPPSGTVCYRSVKVIGDI